MDDKLKQQAAEQAVPVGSPHILNVVQEIRDEVKREKKDDDFVRRRKLLDQLSEMEEWAVLRTELERRISVLRRSFNDHLAAGKIDLNDIGLRSLIINEVGNAFQDVINMVELSKKKLVIPSSDDMPETVGLDKEVENT